MYLTRQHFITMLIAGITLIFYFSSTLDRGHSKLSKRIAASLPINFVKHLTIDDFEAFAKHDFHFNRSGYIIESFDDEQGNPEVNSTICLFSQASLDRLHWIVDMARNWGGPMSVAVFLPDEEYGMGLEIIRRLKNCYKFLNEDVKFSVVYPADHPPKDVDYLDDVQQIFDKVGCSNHKALFDKLLKLRSKQILSWRDSYPYPYNIMRNVAKQNCRSYLTYILDIDMIPVSNLNKNLVPFFRGIEPCHKCIYIIPTFELSDMVTTPPRSKTELIALVRRGKARICHEKIFLPNQGSSKLKRWLKLPKTQKETIAYEVSYHSMYEPTYVAVSSHLPPFDERFVGSGRDRNSQAFELFAAGYRFFILNNAFTIHWGFQRRSKLTSLRMKQQALNNAKFPSFLSDVNDKYGKTISLKQFSRL